MPADELAEITRKGGIPLVSIEISSEADSAISLRVHNRDRDSKYVAISHVWADGLGNPHQNALPSCQIRQLEANLAALQKVFKLSEVRMHFIIGTLYLLICCDLASHPLLDGHIVHTCTS
jgi:hypothetical protein